jgi:hypothetical protein
MLALFRVQLRSSRRWVRDRAGVLPAGLCVLSSPSSLGDGIRILAGILLKLVLIPFFALLLTSCATHPSVSRRSWALAQSNDVAITVGPDRRQLFYEVRSAQSDKLLGKAQSHWRTEKSVTTESYSHRNIVFAPDLSTISIVEDLSDSYSTKRYILFTRTPDGKYSVSYLHPPAVKIPPPTGISEVYPEIQSLTATTITFSDVNKRVYTVPIAKIPVFAFPQSAQ